MLVEFSFKDSKRARALKADKDPSSSTSPARLAADISAYDRLLEAAKPQGTSSWGRKTVFFLLSAAASYLAFGLTVSWRDVPVWLGIILVHELGHLAAMWVCGYHNRQILFLPFIGAATMGHTEDATPMQQTFVCLMGPMPGLVFGLWGLYETIVFGNTGGFWYSTAMISVILNYGNLLPVLPLDGGHVVQSLFFARLPRLQFGFALFSTLVFAAAAWGTQEPLLFIFAFFFFLTLPGLWRSGTLTACVANRLSPQTDKTERLRTIAQVVAESSSQHKPLTTRFSMVQTLMQHFASPPPSGRTQLAGGACYAIALLAPFWVGGVYGLFQLPDEERFSALPDSIYTFATGQVREPNWDAKLQRAAAPDERAHLLVGGSLLRQLLQCLTGGFGRLKESLKSPVDPRQTQM